MRINKLTLPITVVLLASCATGSDMAAPQLEATYDLYEKSDRSRVVTTMTIFNQNGSKFLIQGNKWGGSGGVDGSRGYYDWNFTDGRSGRTRFTVQGDGGLIGHVSGSGINWVYIAIPRTKPRRRIAPKQCKTCFAEEKRYNNGRTENFDGDNPVFQPK